jgi:hypothetical protein
MANHSLIICQVCSGGSHPNEFDALVGKKMLFSVQKSPTLGLAISSYRVKRICMVPTVIDQFCSATSNPVSPKVLFMFGLLLLTEFCFYLF